MSARDKLKKITKKFSRKLLGLPPEPVPKVDSDTRKLVREVLSQSIYTRTPSEPLPPPPVTIVESERGATHVNFHKKSTTKIERTTTYYTEDGRLLY